ncbi:YolD-like family protein [Virgibacillus dakarensis]|uniref:YolD-like family protein n=1 Tax=Lentibacillus populi TaxID=1827502 RepID=A0A9W5X785_9BACI|nr:MULTISPECIES: YolD-like family protein [Bacillaceae]MBT2214655.1 YolD-like family protein [Virgibacillus dakarensis]MTW87947.1 YolD-like family protein [Virgibacillus dakarensis]GGB58302.1 hypothetical protein GCM10011409_39730 [Lentibacillus populi]
MAHDRGSIKWTSLMIPEHVELLKRTWEELERKQKPMIDEQRQEEINVKLQMALKDALTVEIQYFENHDYHKVKGKIGNIDLQNKHIKIVDHCLPLENIIDVYVD